jgi:predicted CXXCH cytochrome family protein
MGVMRKLMAAVTVVFLLVLSWEAHGAMLDPSHMDKRKVPKGCADCHSGRGASRSALLKASSDKICLLCHGSMSRLKSSTDIEAVFKKESRHPVFETSQIHWFGEKLPEESSSTSRHVSCYDCHNTHKTERDKPWKAVRGYSPGLMRGMGIGGGAPPGQRLIEADELYQLCYLCHADSANLPDDATNTAVAFDTMNESYHPVELPGRNSFVPSLVRVLHVTSTISCTDCHGNDDPRGPRGPHGSDNSPLLVGKYRTEEGREGAKVYELCYMCHKRRSILGNESFRRHTLHIVKVRTSCHTCHDAHGSVDNKHLIEFYEEVVEPSDVDAGPTYELGPAGMPKCYLKCHETDHNRDGIGDNPWPW